MFETACGCAARPSPPVAEAFAAPLLALLEERGLTVATAESLTGGLVVARLVDVPGASTVVAGGVCTYSFEAKARILGLDRADLEARGAVRESVAVSMARAAQRIYGADVALATTGVAGPGPDPYGVPAGTAFVACAVAGSVHVRELRLTGERACVRAGVVDAALALGIEALTSTDAGGVGSEGP